MPDFSFEKLSPLFVCGLDEVGRAPLAGPVVAACVFIPLEKRGEDIWCAVNDSKLIAAAKRDRMVEEIKTNSAWAIAEASAREVEDINIVQASFLAMRRAMESMCVAFGVSMEHALVDGHIAPKLPCKVQTIIKGDSKSVSIAAASIIAKVYRDNLMAELAEQHPHYGWERNAGYPTPEHLAAIDRHGITPHHRKTFAPVRNFLEFGQVQRQFRFAV